MEKSVFEFTGNDFGTADHSRNRRTSLYKRCYDLVFHGIFCVYLLWNPGALLWSNFIYCCKQKKVSGKWKNTGNASVYWNCRRHIGDTDLFFRCSKSMILNADKIDYVHPSISGRFEAVLSNGETVLVSRKYVNNLKHKLGMWR